MRDPTHLSDETARTVGIAAVRVFVLLVAGLDLVRLALFFYRPASHPPPPKTNKQERRKKKTNKKTPLIYHVTRI